MSRELRIGGWIAIALLAVGCDIKPEVVSVAGKDPQAELLKAARPVSLPPAIAASRTYRCKDNRLLFVDFLTDRSARVRQERDGPVIAIRAAGDGGPFEGDGVSVSANAKRIEYKTPGRGTQFCVSA